MCFWYFFFKQEFFLSIFCCMCVCVFTSFSLKKKIIFIIIKKTFGKKNFGKRTLYCLVQNLFYQRNEPIKSAKVNHSTMTFSNFFSNATKLNLNLIMFFFHFKFLEKNSSLSATLMVASTFARPYLTSHASARESTSVGTMKKIPVLAFTFPTTSIRPSSNAF